MEQGKKEHKRRVRYSGTHPKRFEEKYKELNPEKYKETVDKIIGKGNTPAGMHIPIMVQEIIDFLQIKKGQKGLDATLGYGGHSSAMLKELQGQGHLYALDIDPIEIKKTTTRMREKGFGEDILTIKQINFSQIDELCAQVGKFDFVLADLGCSSMQIDNPERGFTFKKEGPLDLRLNPEKGIPASERLKELSKDEFEGMLIENADEPYAHEIAEEVFKKLSRGESITTTTELHDRIAKALTFLPKKDRDMAIKKSSQRVFQALRIDVNHEFEVLYEFLEKLPGILNPGGRVAVLTFHSGEDRLVKKSFKQLENEGIYSEAARAVIRPSEEECRKNARAKSTKLRWAIKA